MKNTLLVLAACIFSLPLFAQNTVNEAKMMGDPIPGVGVNLTTKDGVLVQQVKTDATGNATFSKLAQGHYLLTIVSPRDVATGQASGKHEIKSPRDIATGQASGKRTTSNTVISPRDISTGQASGKRTAEASTSETGTSENNQTETRAGISTSRSNIRRTVAAEVLVTGDDDTPPAKNAANIAEDVFQVSILDGSQNTQKGVNTSRSNIKSQRIQHSGDPHEVVVGADGQLICNVLKTKHDTAKNSINNVR